MSQPVFAVCCCLSACAAALLLPAFTFPARASMLGLTSWSARWAAGLPCRKKEAMQEKEAGNEAYKKRQFEQALAHYSRCAPRFWYSHGRVTCLSLCRPAPCNSTQASLRLWMASDPATQSFHVARSWLHAWVGADVRCGSLSRLY